MGLVRCCVVVGTPISFKKCHIGNNVDLLGESVSTSPSLAADIHQDVYEHDENMQDTSLLVIESFNGFGTLLRCSTLQFYLKVVIENNVEFSGESVATIPPADIHVFERDTNMQYMSPVESFIGPGTLLRCSRHFNFI